MNLFIMIFSLSNCIFSNIEMIQIDSYDTLPLEIINRDISDNIDTHKIKDLDNPEIHYNSQKPLSTSDHLTVVFKSAHNINKENRTKLLLKKGIAKNTEKIIQKTRAQILNA